MTSPMAPKAIRRLMTAPSSPDRWAKADLRVARVLLRHHEEVAQSTERAYLELRRIGIDDDRASYMLTGH